MTSSKMPLIFGHQNTLEQLAVRIARIIPKFKARKVFSITKVEPK